MGTRGPAPKREGQRRRRNKPESDVTKAAGATEVKRPRINGKWHPVAKRWFLSLEDSGQSSFYEPSDWALAEMIAESMSRDLRPQFVGLDDKNKKIMAAKPINGAAMGAYLKAMSSLLVTEADRRRSSIELTRPEPEVEGDKGGSGVSWIDDARRRRGGTG